MTRILKILGLGVGVVLILLPLLGRLQKNVIHSWQAVDGSFGLRPVTHACWGRILKSTDLRGLPPADIRVDLFPFWPRYALRLWYYVLPSETEQGPSLPADHSQFMARPGSAISGLWRAVQ